MIHSILEKKSLTKEDVLFLLQTKGQYVEDLFSYAASIKEKYIGKKVVLRGLIEFSNICEKDCYYCGIRKGNKSVSRFNVTDKDILEAVQFAYENDYGSLALQSGELQSKTFTNRVACLLKEIDKLSKGTLGVTLSCGEQTEETYQRWFDAGAHRYLLRIETSNKELYQKIHPHNELHRFNKRIACLESLQKVGFQTGTGVMIGLPFQTIENLAEDLLFMQTIDIDMCGMGPYLLHEDTPLAKYSTSILPLTTRLELSLKMVAILRILMKDINIAATTALQAIEAKAREKAVEIGANVLMPNITPGFHRNNYNLYQNKPRTTGNFERDGEHLQDTTFGNAQIIYGKRGDSLHYFGREVTTN